MSRADTPIGDDPDTAEREARPSRAAWRRRFLGPLVSLAFVALAAGVAYQRRDELAALLEDPGPELIAIAVLIVVGHFLNSSEFWVLYRAQGLDIGLLETWELFLANQLGNLAPGQLGTAYRFRYLKVVHDFRYAESGSNFAMNLAITLGSSALAGLIGLVLTTADGVSPSPILWMCAIGLGAASVLAMLVPLPRLDRLSGRPARIWVEFRQGWEAVRRRPRTAAAVLALDVGKYLLVALRFQIAFGLLGVEESFGYFLVIAPAAGLAGMISFTPGGIGVREVIITAAAVGLGSSFDAGLLAATVDRGVMLLTSLVLGSWGLWRTRRRMAHAVPDRE